MPVADLLNPQLSEFEVIVNRKTLPDEMRPFVGGVVVDDSLDVPGMFAIEMVSSFELDDVNQWIDEELFTVGNIVEIKHKTVKVQLPSLGYTLTAIIEKSNVEILSLYGEISSSNVI